jgi:hypothetical protein
MCFLSHALEARTQWALHRIALIAGNADAAGDYLTEAQISAMDSGIAAFHADAELPHLLADVPVLTAEWNNAWDGAAEDHARGATVWIGTWSSDLDGLRETRASVLKRTEGFCPGLEVSYQGGDCEPSYGDALPTLEEAISAAEKRESDWHLTDV